MPKLTVNQTINTLPTWDSFEAVFFVFGGLSVGIVLGILFPSLWRTFRRRFRKPSQYAPLASDHWVKEKENQIKLHILNSDDSGDTGEAHVSQQNVNIKIAEAFILSRFYFQNGRARDCVKIYIDILTNEAVSKEETNQALFELSQVYRSLGLISRAYDTAFELLNRKPNHNKVLNHLVTLCSEHQMKERFNHILSIYNGSPDLSLQRTVAHAFASVGEEFLNKNQISEAVDYAHRSLKWDRASGRALILLWEASNRDIWNRTNLDLKSKWVALGASLESRGQVHLTSEVSPIAGAEHLRDIFENVCQTPGFIESFQEVEREFHQALEWKKFSLEAEKKLLESIFYALLLLQGKNETRDHPALPGLLALITSKTKGTFVLNAEFPLQFREAIKMGFFAHRCQKCSAFSTRFRWQCPSCGEKESLLPIVSPL